NPPAAENFTFDVTYHLHCYCHRRPLHYEDHSQTLNSPMYFFLTFFSLIDACYSSSIIPIMLTGLLSETKAISFNGCMIQLFVEYCLRALEIVLLGLLCGPVVTSVPCEQDEPLNLLYSNHFCCDIFLLLQLAYTNTFIIGFLIVPNGGVIPMKTFMMLLMSPSNVTEFVLLDLTQNPHLQKILFIVFLFVSLFTMLANLLIVITISFSRTLSAPMYFFLTYLSIIDTFYTSVTTPKIIIDLLYQRKTISLGGCLIQLFVEHFLRGTKIILLIVMAYDRYVAICKPLHYMTIMR
ncbi:hypothetical protein U0070_021064, partial [Myodes glareolus]